MNGIYFIQSTGARGNVSLISLLLADVAYAGSVGLKKSQEVLECRPGTPALLLWSLETTRHAGGRVR